MANSSAVVTTSSLPSLSEVNLPNYTFPFKLDQNNCITWRSQILPTIIGCNLEGFINRSLQAPPITSAADTISDGQTITLSISNPDYHQWRRLDQALLG